MRGIAGWISNNNSFKEDIVIKMASSFSSLAKERADSGIYRGQNVRLLNRSILNDGENIYIEPFNLSVLNSGEYTVVFSGSIYNIKELKEKLLQNGIIVSSKRVEEILLKSFIKWGKNFLEDINGVFSLAIWSNQSKELFLARDKIGVKTLYFYEYEKGIVFASYIKILLSNPIIKPILDETGLKELFLLGPGKTPGSGVIRGVKELLPGECVVYSGNKLERYTYWKLRAREFKDSLGVCIEKTRFLIEDAINRQLTSKKPLCCLLSGGLDSSIVSKVAADYYKNKSLGRLTTFSVDYFNNEKYFKKSLYQPNSDKEFINIIVDYIKSFHKIITLSNGNLGNALFEATIARGLPGMADIDSSLLLFCKEIKKDFDIAFSGECSDELFGGYPWYHNKDALFKESFPWSSSMDLRKKILKNGLINDADEYVYEKYKETVNSADKLPKETKLSSRMREMFLLNLNWFMQTLLVRGDTMSMYSDLELRVPFCDYRIVEYAYNMPWEIKSLKGREKGIIREAMKGILPEKIVQRKKSPYPKTHNPIFMSAVFSRVKEILKDKSSIISQILNYENIISLMNINDQSGISPWYGQLMNIPQLMAYIIQIDCFIKYFKIQLA